MEKTLKERFAELTNAKFSEPAWLEFFGSLHESEIKLLLSRLNEAGFSVMPMEQRKFLQMYLEKLLQKVVELNKKNIVS